MALPTDLPWCVIFPENSIPHIQFSGQCLHPTQLYSSLYGLFLFFTLHKLDEKKKFYGSTFSFLLIFEAVFRHLIEYVRYYEPEMVTSIADVTLTYNSVMAVLLFVTGLTLRPLLRKRQLIARN